MSMLWRRWGDIIGTRRLCCSRVSPLWPSFLSFILRARPLGYLLRCGTSLMRPTSFRPCLVLAMGSYALVRTSFCRRNQARRSGPYGTILLIGRNDHARQNHRDSKPRFDCRDHLGSCDPQESRTELHGVMSFSYRKDPFFYRQ